MSKYDKVLSDEFGSGENKKRRGRPKAGRGRVTGRDLVLNAAAERVFAYLMLFPDVQQSDESLLLAIKEVAEEKESTEGYWWWRSLLRKRERSMCDNGLARAVTGVKKRLLELERVSGEKPFSRSHPGKAAVAPPRTECQGAQSSELDIRDGGASVSLEGERRENGSHFLGNPGKDIAK